MRGLSVTLSVTYKQVLRRSKQIYSIGSLQIYQEVHKQVLITCELAK